MTSAVGEACLPSKVRMRPRGRIAVVAAVLLWMSNADAAAPLCPASPKARAVKLVVDPPVGLVGETFTARIEGAPTAADQLYVIEWLPPSGASVSSLVTPEHTSRAVLGEQGRYGWRVLRVRGVDALRPDPACAFEDIDPSLCPTYVEPSAESCTMAQGTDGPLAADPGAQIELHAPALVDRPLDRSTLPLSIPIAVTAAADVPAPQDAPRWQIAWRLGPGEWRSGGLAPLDLELPVGRHRLEVFAFRSSAGELIGARAVQVIEVRAPEASGLDVAATASHRCEVARATACSVELRVEIGDAVIGHAEWQPRVDQPARVVPGARVEVEYPPGRHTARVFLQTSDGRRATRDVAILIDPLRVAIAPVVAAEPWPFAREIEASLAGWLESHASLRHAAGPTVSATTLAELCALRSIEPDVLVRYVVEQDPPWDYQLCPRLDRAGDGRRARVRVIGVQAGDYGDIELDVPCPADDEQNCLARLLTSVSDSLATIPTERILRSPGRARVATGTVIIESEPDGAAVSAEGLPLGHTPLTLLLPIGRRYRFDVGPVAAGGAQPVEVRLVDDSTRRIRVRLRGDRTPLVVSTTPAAAHVYLDERYLGPSPIVAEPVSRGRHLLRVSAAGYRTHEAWVEVHDSSGAITVELEALGHPLTVVNHGVARYLFVDRRPEGLLAGGAAIELAGLQPGRHRICVHHRREIAQAAEARCVDRELPTSEPVVFYEVGPPLGLPDGVEPVFVSADAISLAPKLVEGPAFASIEIGVGLSHKHGQLLTAIGPRVLAATGLGCLGVEAGVLLELGERPIYLDRHHAETRLTRLHAAAHCQAPLGPGAISMALGLYVVPEIAVGPWWGLDYTFAVGPIDAGLGAGVGAYLPERLGPLGLELLALIRYPWEEDPS